MSVCSSNSLEINVAESQSAGKEKITNFRLSLRLTGPACSDSLSGEIVLSKSNRQSLRQIGFEIHADSETLKGFNSDDLRLLLIGFAHDLSSIERVQVSLDVMQA